MHLGAAGLALTMSLITADEASAPPAPKTTQVKVIPDSDKLEQTRTSIARMRDILARVLKHLEDARDERDIVKLNCVNEKLTAIKGLLKISEQSDVTLQESLARRDAEAAAHELEKVSIALRKCEQLMGESEGCVGELAVYAGDTEVEMVVEGVPSDDPTANKGVPDVVFRPPAASPYQ